MITWVTVWVLTVTHAKRYGSFTESHYQLQYASQVICEKQRKNHESALKISRCDFQQIPVVVK